MVRGMLLVLCIVLGAVAGELQAPEVTGTDMYGYHYQFREDGSICDPHGVIRGWVLGNRIYDTWWNSIYEMKEGRLQKVPDEVGG
jgi:hypothetical protein